MVLQNVRTGPGAAQQAANGDTGRKRGGETEEGDHDAVHCAAQGFGAPDHGLDRAAYFGSETDSAASFDCAAPGPWIRDEQTGCDRTAEGDAPACACVHAASVVGGVLSRASQCKSVPEVKNLA